jgi:hypothetical protein
MTAAKAFVCFPCRYVAKAIDGEMMDRRCPNCQQPLLNCGKAFKVPKKDDDDGWKAARDWLDAFTRRNEEFRRAWPNLFS